MKTLVSRLKQIVLVLKRMESGEIPFDPVVARQAAALVARLPATETHSDTVKELSTETCDAMMSVLLASVTKGSTRGMIEFAGSICTYKLFSCCHMVSQEFV